MRLLALKRAAQQHPEQRLTDSSLVRQVGWKHFSNPGHFLPIPLDYTRIVGHEHVVNVIHALLQSLDVSSWSLILFGEIKFGREFLLFLLASATITQLHTDHTVSDTCTMAVSATMRLPPKQEQEKRGGEGGQTISPRSSQHGRSAGEGC